MDRDRLPPKRHSKFTSRTNRAGHIPGSLPWLICGLVLWASVASESADAAGIDRTITGDDLKLIIDTRWAGCGYGGYLPIRLQLTNTGPSREIDISYTVGTRLRVSRKLVAETNSTIKTTLSIPLVSNESYGMFQLRSNGRELDRFRTSINGPDFVSSGDLRPSLIVISRDLVDCGAWEAALRPATSSPYGSSSRSEDHEIVSPDLLPEKWIDYVGVDIIAIPLPVLEKLSPASRDPILEWVTAGGMLLIYEAGKDPEPLAQAIHLGGRASARPFQMLSTDNRSISAVASPEATVSTPPGRGSPKIVAPSGSGSPAPREVPWFSEQMAVRRADFGMGQILAFAENPFPGSVGDWNWAFAGWPNERRTLPARYGVAPRDGEHMQFFEFLIPGVGAAPVTMFMVLMSLFALAIGPINLWILSRQRKLYLMLVTVPVLSLLTCVSLFVYAIVADGFSIRSRIRSMTFLDQGSATAVKVARVSLYAGLSPSAGLKFDPKTAVLPVWPNFDVNQDRSVDWTSTQHLVSGWLPSRTHTQFLTIAQVPERGRVNVGTPSGDNLKIDNGLATDLKLLLVADDQGKIWIGRDISAGASAELSPRVPDPNGRDDIRYLFVENAPALPAGLNSVNEIGHFYGSPMRMYRYGGYSPNSNFASSLLEQFLRVPATTSSDSQFPTSGVSDRPLRKRSYTGVFAANPGIEAGGLSSVESASLHVIVGHY